MGNIFSGTAIKTNATKLLNDLRITRQNLLATFIDEVAKPEQVFVSKIPPFLIQNYFFILRKNLMHIWN